jgi:hypothetical protein
MYDASIGKSDCLLSVYQAKPPYFVNGYAEKITLLPGFDLLDAITVRVFRFQTSKITPSGTSILIEEAFPTSARY